MPPNKNVCSKCKTEQNKPLELNSQVPEVAQEASMLLEGKEKQKDKKEGRGLHSNPEM